jgi:23S rRNA pseudouridine1911/1915/1917 synthase
MNDVDKINILYEDNHVICAVKPRGVLSQADGSDAPDMLTLLKGYIKNKYDKRGEAYLGLVHRLDRPVGGVMAFARTSKAAGRLSEQFRERAVKRIYLAVLDRAPEKVSGRLEHKIRKDRAVNIVSVSEMNGIGEDDKEYAALEYTVVGLARGHDRSSDPRVLLRSPCGQTKLTRGQIWLRSARTDSFLETPDTRPPFLALVRIMLLTGRPHQIRAQFAYIGNPVAGDRKYGAAAADIRLPGPALWAASLEFSHPVLNTPLYAAAPPPDEQPWAAFDIDGMFGINGIFGNNKLKSKGNDY